MPGVNPRYLRVTGQGDVVTLELEADATTGMVRMKKEGGTWKIVKERQTDRESGRSWNPTVLTGGTRWGQVLIFHYSRRL